jgi:putative peptide zinc metalloprotease protein
VDGALQARQPGDPGGIIRHHVGPGGVVGLANALTGRSTTLDWHTAGTTLLSLPTATVATVVGPLPGPPPKDRAEAEALFADTPALAALAADERLALIAAAHPVDLEPGAPVILPGPTHAVVVESGVIAMPDGVELRRGTLVGPVGDGSPGMVAQTRTPVRLWVIPDASSLPPLVGAAHRPGDSAPIVRGRTAPAAGVHPTGTYPPLAIPPGPPDGTEDPDVDRRFERRMWWLVLLLLLLALLLTATNFVPGPAWAEMPTDRALLTADRGRLIALIDGRNVTLEQGDRRYVPANTRVEVNDRSLGRLTFQGGSATLLCAGSRVQVGRLVTDAGRHRDPYAAITVDTGRLLADTTSTSGAYRPLALVVKRTLGDVSNSGVAWFAVDPSAVTVSTGRVSVAGTLSEPTEADLNCGDGVPSESPSVEPPSDLPSESPTPSPTPTTAPPVIPQPNNPPNQPNPPRTTPPKSTPPKTTPPKTTPPVRTTPPSPSASTSSSSSPSPSESTSTTPPIG